MKQTLKRRICAAILCHILLLGLAGCGKANKAKPNDGGDPPVKASVDALKQGQPAADSEETVDGAESLARVRGDLEYDGRLTGRGGLSRPPREGRPNRADGLAARKLCGFDL